MHIGEKENFLSIECTSNDGVAVLKLEAGAFHDEQKFTARVWTVGEWNDGTRQEFADFEDFRVADFEMRLAAGGWLRLNRDYRGWIAMRYRITSSRGPDGTAMEGEIWVEGEHAGDFCRRLHSVLVLQR